MDDVRAAVVATAEALIPLLEDERVSARWSEPSALEGLTIGGLAGHLARATETVERYLDDPEPPDQDLERPARYFSPGLVGGRGPGSAEIVERAEAAGAIGPTALVAEHRARIERLRERVAAEPETRRIVMKQGTARMLLDDYLPTRLVEMAVHADDLAVSIGAPTPELAPDVRDVVIGLLVATARERHGDVAVLRALTRRERDDVEALRVL